MQQRKRQRLNFRSRMQSRPNCSVDRSPTWTAPRPALGGGLESRANRPPAPARFPRSSINADFAGGDLPGIVCSGPRRRASRAHRLPRTGRAVPVARARKRHILVDTGGLVLRARVNTADIQRSRGRAPAALCRAGWHRVGARTGGRTPTGCNQSPIADRRLCTWRNALARTATPSGVIFASLVNPSRKTQPPVPASRPPCAASRG